MSQLVHRRWFLTLGLAASACSLLAACGGNAQAPAAPTQAAAQPKPTQAQAAPTQAPVSATAPTSAPASAPTTAPATTGAQPKVDRLVMSVPALVTESGELRNMSSPEIWPFRSVYEYPIAIDPQTMKFVPGLATEWSLEPDGMSYRFKLRQGVQFHYGKGEMTAKDFVGVYQDIIKPDSLHGQSSYWRTALTGIDVVNDYELVYHLARSDGQFLTAMSESQGGMEIRSKDHADSVPNKTIQTPIAGTGPYQIKERAQSQYARLERVPFQHWRGNAAFPEFEWRFQNEASTRLASLLSGESHLADLPQDLRAQAVQQGFSLLTGVFPGVRVFGTFQGVLQKTPGDPSSGWVYPNSPLMDVRVREALNRAVNKDEMNSVFFGGKGLPMQVNHFLPSRPGWNPDWVQKYPQAYGYDPERAKQLLADAGQSALKMTIHLQPVAGLSGGEDLAEAVGTYWTSVGVDVTLQQIDGAQLAAQQRALAIDRGMTLRGTGSNQYTGITQFNSALSATGRGGADDPQIDMLLKQITNTLDEQKQDDLWRQVGDRLFNGYLGLNLFWLPAEAAANSSIVSSWLFPGAITGTWTHLQNLKPA